MRVLGIDTATWRASVGLSQNDEVVCERSQLTQGNHAASLLALIESVLEGAGASIGDLDGIAVSAGPGSFTGLRVGLSVGKGLARALALPLVAVPTLEALANTVVGDRSGVICPLLDARKGELYAACYEVNALAVRCLWPATVLSAKELLEKLPTPCTVLGDAVVAYGDLLRASLGSAVTVLPFETHGPRGAVVALMGAQRLHEDGPADLATIEPFYIRACEAETKRDKPLKSNDVRTSVQV